MTWKAYPLLKSSPHEFIRKGEKFDIAVAGQFIRPFLCIIIITSVTATIAQEAVDWGKIGFKNNMLKVSKFKCRTVLEKIAEFFI